MDGAPVLVRATVVAWTHRVGRTGLRQSGIHTCRAQVADQHNGGQSVVHSPPGHSVELGSTEEVVKVTSSRKGLAPAIDRPLLGSNDCGRQRSTQCAGMLAAVVVRNSSRTGSPWCRPRWRVGRRESPAGLIVGPPAQTQSRQSAPTLDGSQPFHYSVLDLVAMSLQWC